jgi:hypothetical protein
MASRNISFALLWFSILKADGKEIGNLMLRDATQLTTLELVARLRDSAESLRENGHRSVLADWCEEAAARLRDMQHSYIDSHQRRCA